MKHRIIPIIGDNVLSPFWVALIARFIADHVFDIQKFIAWDTRNRVIGGKK